jgi:hypothetical protein
MTALQLFAAFGVPALLLLVGVGVVLATRSEDAPRHHPGE